MLDLNFNFILLTQGIAYHCPNTWNFGPICSSFSRFYYVTKGEANVKINNDWHKIREGHIYLIPSLTPHYDSCSEDFEHYYIHFADSNQKDIHFYNNYIVPFELKAIETDMMIITRLRGLLPDVQLDSPHPSTYETPDSILSATKRFKSLPPEVKMEINASLQLLMLRFIKLHKPKYNVTDNRILNSLHEIERRLNEKIQLEELANIASYAYSSFCRQFRKQVGCSPNEYIINRRLEKAMQMLSSGCYSVKETAMSCGYPNVSYFVLAFKKKTGMTPKEFVKTNK